MYPPFFATGDKPIPEKRSFDKYSFRLLTEFAALGPGNIIGFHPEGNATKAESLFVSAAATGRGEVIKDAEPQVIPVFIAGLGNDLTKQVLGNWSGGEKSRIHFGPQIHFSKTLARRDHMRTYKEISELCDERDRRNLAKKTGRSDGMRAQLAWDRDQLGFMAARDSRLGPRL